MAYTTENAGKTLSQDDRDEICRLYEAGTPAREIVAKYGIHRTTLPKIYKRTRGITRSLQPQVCNPRYFQTIDSHEKAYFVGFIAADGCIVDTHEGRGDRFVMNIHEKDRVVVDRLKEVLQLEHPIYEIADKDQVTIAFTSQELCDDLRLYGMGYRKSLVLGNLFPLVPEEFRDSFALGYNDGDGCILVKKTLYTSSKGYHRTYENPAFSICGTREFLYGFAEHFDLASTVIVLRKSIYALDINRRDDFWKVYDRLYANADKTVHLARKRNVINRLEQVQTISSSVANDNVPTELGARVPLIA